MTVTNRQIIDGDTEIISEKGMGSLRCKDGKYYVMYKTDTATVMIKLCDGKANVKRTGASSSDIDYIKGKKTQFSYSTPYGEIKMELFTKSVDCSLSLNGGIIRLMYDLFTGDGGFIENYMEINIKASK